MNIKDWLREKLENWLGIPALRKEIAGWKEQLELMGKAQTEFMELTDESVRSQSKRIDNVVTTANQAVMEAEERVLIRITGLEEKVVGHDYTKNEADAPSGGYVPWTERKRRAEQAASDPSKWTKKAVAQET